MARRKRSEIARYMDALRSVSELQAYLDGIAVTLRETASGLDEWWRSGGGNEMHPYHAANRLRKIAKEIDGGKDK